MRVFSVFALVAGVVLAAGGVSPADDKKSDDKEKKLMRPDLKAKEWKKLDSGLEIWDVKEGTGEAVKVGPASRRTPPSSSRSSCWRTSSPAGSPTRQRGWDVPSLAPNPAA